jgi:hypothetical protein
MQHRNLYHRQVGDVVIIDLRFLNINLPSVATALEFKTFTSRLHFGSVPDRLQATLA